MSYKINKTDGTLLVDLIDGRIDQDTTDLTLVGRNYKGYGEIFNENFVQMLENFSNNAPPSNPLRGQLWYDTEEGRLKVWTGTEFKATDTTTVSDTQPTLIAGDVWIDSGRKQIYFSDGTSDLILAGPGYTAQQGETGWRTVTVIDNFGIERIVALLMISGSPAALVSKEDFTAAATDANLALIPNFAITIKAGFNISTAFADFEFDGNAATTSALLDSTLQSYTPDDFLKLDPPLDSGSGQRRNTSNGVIFVNDDNGLYVGTDGDLRTFVSGNEVYQRLQNTTTTAFRMQYKSSGIDTDFFTLDRSSGRIGLFTSSPTSTVDITGDLKISGDLLVEGDATYLNVATLRVEDKQIELATTDDSSTQTDAQVNESGIVVKVDDGDDKEWIWELANNAWNTNKQNINLTSGYAYMIGNSNVLTQNELGASVVSAPGLTSLGTLSSLQVDYLNLDNATITATTFPLNIISEGDIVVAGTGGSPNVKITGVTSPEVSDPPDYVATKGYVDELYKDTDIKFSLDITGLSNIQIALVLEDLFPAVGYNTGVYCFVHTVDYSAGGTTSFDVDDSLTKSLVAVDSNGVQNQSVLQDISFTTQVATVSFSPTRGLKRFIIDGAYNWIFVDDLVSSV